MILFGKKWVIKNMNKVKLNEICQFLNGYAFKSKQYVDDGIRIIRIANVQKGKIIDDAPCFYPSNRINEIENYLLSENDLLISLTGNVGRVGLLTRDMLPAALNQRVSCIRILNKNVVFFKYLYYYLQQNAFERDCIKASNGVAQLNLSTKWLENYQIFLPSLEEQQLIVTKIEELFSKLDKGVEELNKIKDQLKIYRQSVLKEAFKKCDDMKRVDEVCEHVTDGDHMPPPKSDKGIPFIMISNIKNNTIDFENTNFVQESYYNNIGNKRTPQIGDVLYTVTGSYGIPVLIDFNKKFCFQRHIALLRPNNLVEQKFLYYVMQTPDVYQQATKRATGTAQKTVGLAVLRDIKIPYTSKELQRNIVCDVESKLSVCDKIEQAVNESLQKAESLRQSILKQAFEGGLV